MKERIARRTALTVLAATFRKRVLNLLKGVSLGLRSEGLRL
jgi:hypothetical protein